MSRNQKLVRVDHNVLNEIEAGVYAFNLSGEQKLYLNKFILEPLQHLNNVYNIPFEEMLRKTIHGDDIEFLLNGYEYMIENPSMVHMMFRRALKHVGSDYYWYVNFIGLLDLAADQNRVLGLQIEIDPRFRASQDHVESISKAGFLIDEETISSQLGPDAYPYIKYVSEGYSQQEIQKKMSFDEEQYASLSHLLKFKLNIPAEWDRYMSNVLSYLVI